MYSSQPLVGLWTVYQINCELVHTMAAKFGFQTQKRDIRHTQDIANEGQSVDGSRRVGVAPVPDNLSQHLNEAQLSGLHKIEGFGWAIKYVRRAVVVLVYKDGETLGLLASDGSLNHHATVRERADTTPDPQQPGFKKFIV